MNDDLISRSALTEQLKERLRCCNHGSICEATYGAVVALAGTQFTIDAEPVVHGRWERIPLNATDDRYGMNKHNMRIKCTACGFVTSSDFIGFRYCHSCGAKMDAQENPNG